MKRIRFIYTKDRLNLRLDEQRWVSQADYIFFSGDLIPLELLAGRKTSAEVKKLFHRDEIELVLAQNLDIVVLFESKSKMKDIVLTLNDIWINKRYIESLKSPLKGKQKECMKHQIIKQDINCAKTDYTSDLYSFVVAESLKPMLGTFWGN